MIQGMLLSSAQSGGTAERLGMVLSSPCLGVVAKGTTSASGFLGSD